MIEISAVPAFRDNYIWLITDPRTGNTAIVDPGDADPVLETIDRRQLSPIAILVTHHHRDHIGGIETLRRHYPLPVYGPATESIPALSHPLREGDRITLDAIGTGFTILDVPGHTLGHIAYHGAGRLFIGDTLFMAGCGRLFEGTATQLYHSLNKVANLPNDTLIYCTHEYTLANLAFARTVEPHNSAIPERIARCTAQRDRDLPTIPADLACEKTTNPFLRTHEPAVIAAAEKFAGTPLAGAAEVFAALRKWKDHF